MSSNEHPDMSGNPCDAPYMCEKCGREFSDDAKLCGSFFSAETILCSQECSVEYDYAIAEQLTAENARLRELLRECKEQLRDWLCDVDMNTDPRLSWYDAQICKSNVTDTNTILAKIDGELGQ